MIAGISDAEKNTEKSIGGVQGSDAPDSAPNKAMGKAIDLGFPDAGEIGWAASLVKKIAKGPEGSVQ